MAQPNILHIFTDQQRFDTIRALGNPTIRTPNLDWLARTGTAFTSCYSPSPVCISARASMIFGQYPYHTGCYENTEMPTDERNTMMTALSNAGYITHGIGKCHFTPEKYALRGFQSREVQEEGGCPFDELDSNHYYKHLYDTGYRTITEPHGVRGEMYYVPQPSQMPAHDHPTQWVGDRSAAFIEAREASSQPWYLFSSFIHPHPPFAPPSPWHKLYRAPLMPLPNVPQQWESLMTLVNRVQNRYKYRDQGVDRNLVRVMKAYYYACISFVDFQVGRMIESLRSTGQLENTLILFTADHGEHLGDYNCFGKRSMHDSASRVPMLVRLPGRFDDGAAVSSPASLVDVAPTILSAAGSEIATHEPDGVDLAEVAAGTTDRTHVYSQLSIYPARRWSFLHDTDPSDRKWTNDEWRARFSTYMAVSQEWKYYYSAADQAEFLFDRAGDPLETRNRAGVSLCEEPLDAIRSTLFAELIEAGETAGIAGSAGGGSGTAVTPHNGSRGDTGRDSSAERARIESVGPLGSAPSDDAPKPSWRRFPKVELVDTPDAGLLIQDGFTPWSSTHLPGYSD
jgi:arylsulfatase A-like enzyme